MSNGEIITKEEGKTMVDAYQNSYPSNKKAYLYDSALIQTILNQSGVTGIRIYNGERSNGDTCVVLVGTNAAGDDLTDGVIVERGSPCPTKCPTSSYFN